MFVSHALSWFYWASQANHSPQAVSSVQSARSLSWEAQKPGQLTRTGCRWIHPMNIIMASINGEVSRGQGHFSSSPYFSSSFSSFFFSSSFSSFPSPRAPFLKDPHPWRTLLTILLLRTAVLFPVATVPSLA